MADEIVHDPAHPMDHPEDFVQVAQRLMNPESVKPKPAPTPKVDDPPAPKSKIPEGVFEDNKVDPAPVKVEETSDFDKIEDPTFRDEKRKAQWEEVKSKGREFEKQAKENASKAAALELKIKEYEEKGKGTVALEAKLAEMEKQQEEWRARVQQVNIELDPDFRKTFIEGRSKLIGQAKTIAEESGCNPQDIETALNLSGKARAEALRAVAETMDGFQQGRLGRVIDQLTELDTTAASKRSNPEEYLTQRQQQEEARQKTENEEKGRHANLAFEDAFSKRLSTSEVLRPVDGMEDWNQQGISIRQKARDAWSNNRDMTVAAEKFIAAEEAPVYRSLFLEQRKVAAAAQTELDSLKKELEGLYKRGPKTTGASVANTGAPRDFADYGYGLMNGSIPPPQR